MVKEKMTKDNKINTVYWADVLHGARLNHTPIPQISKEISSFSRAEAYTIQELQMKACLKSGETQVGWKMGLTSEAKRRQMKLDSPLYGFLTDKMQVANEGTFVLEGSIHPKIEPEIAFSINKDLSGTVTREQVLAACGGVASALEILDSRYTEFKYFSMEDVIADNSSSSDFVVGPWVTKFESLDLVNLKMEMSVDGKLVQSGFSKDISGDPVESVVQLCALLAERGQSLKSGSIVLAGAATAAEMLKPGMKISLYVDHLPAVSVSVKGS
ncbi:2-keto-4-pentenoate hydratase [Bdellovibrio sp. HCB337]|uniref:2-keto-4-pentenoate hydratase n=1 Tax=Bdellovibrio sp. HCB337 TaxID=3394358 RepID=UPI0039A70ADD